MKTCKDCKKEKNIEDFYGVQNDCKECYKLRVRKNRIKNKSYYQEYDKHRQVNSIPRIINHRYSMMKMSVEGRNSHKRSVVGMEICTKEEFQNWFYKNIDKFMDMQNKWKENNCSKKYIPSIDRIDNRKGYSLENIQWLTLSENVKKHNHEKKNYPTK